MKNSSLHSTVIIALLLIGNLAVSQVQTVSNSIYINSKDTGRIFDGIGALSAGASSRLLIDYPKKQRDEILDYLFKPNFGAALQINKVEIGGDMNSTDGSEPSHSRTSDDQNYNRGYEWWLMEESKKRNKKETLYALEWGAPHWINPQKNNVWTKENITYILNWIRHAKSDHNLTIDYLGGWNERGYDVTWYEMFRDSLKHAGFKNIKVVADDSFKWKVGKPTIDDAKFSASYDIIGMHYPNDFAQSPNWQLCYNSGKTLWGSEIGSKHYNTGAAALAKMYNKGYIANKMTSFINWSTIWSVFPGLPFSGDGLMLADQPWSGHYVVGLSIWTTAHTTQFAQPGWQYLDNACKYFEGDATKGSFVTLASPNHKDFSLIAETIDAKTSTTDTILIDKAFHHKVLHVWRTDLKSTDEKDWFVQQSDLLPTNGNLIFTFEPHCLYSLTTTDGQHKGTTVIPASANLKLPFKDDFQEYAIGKTPRYFSDQQGTFEVAKATGGRSGKCFKQMITEQPIYWNSSADAGTIIGDTSWGNYTINMDVLLDKKGYVELIGRSIGTKKQNVIPGYHFRLNDDGKWSLFLRFGDKKDSILTSGQFNNPIGIGTWHNLKLDFSENRIAARIDNAPLFDGFKDETFKTGLVGIAMSQWENGEMMNFEVLPTKQPL